MVELLIGFAVVAGGLLAGVIYRSQHIQKRDARLARRKKPKIDLNKEDRDRR